MAQSRRDFLRLSGCALGATALASGIEQFGLISALARPLVPTDYKALVCIFLNGGNDGNNTVVPITDYASYNTVRSASGLAIAQESLLPVTPPSINKQYGLHPSLPGLQTLWTQQKLAVVCNTGPLVQPLTRQQYQSGAPRPYQLFSHSDQTTQWQTSASDDRAQTGWGGRTADNTAGFNNGAGFPMMTSVAGVNIFTTGMNSRPLAISPAPTPLNQVLVLSGFDSTPESVARKAAMDALRTLDLEATLVKAASETTQQSLDISQAFGTDPTLVTAFPNSTLGNQLKQIAKVIKLNLQSPALSLNRQIFFCQLGGFDTHTNQLGAQASLLSQLSLAMKAFYDETVAQGIDSQVTTFTLSDFSRTFQAAGTGAIAGTDHAWGNHLFVMGGAVRGGDFYGVPGSNGTVFPTLQLSGPDDTDTRGRWIPTASVEQYAATLATWYGLSPANLPVVFPLIGRFTTPNLGFMT
jgi:uncharacterized protein (DUF1501 family)